MKEVELTSGLQDVVDAGEALEAPVEVDPFSPQSAPGFSLIVLMRIYDTQLALLREQNPEVAEKLVSLHAEGKILGPLPVLDTEG